MATEELDGVDEAGMEGAGPTHSRRPHAPLRRELREKSRSHHHPVRLRSIMVMVMVMRSGPYSNSAVLVDMVVRQLVSGGQAVKSPVSSGGSGGGGRRGVVQEGEMIDGVKVGGRRVRNGGGRRHWVEAHLGILVFSSSMMVHGQEREGTVLIHRDALDGPQAVRYIQQ